MYTVIDKHYEYLYNWILLFIEQKIQCILKSYNIYFRIKTNIITKSVRCYQRSPSTTCPSNHYDCSPLIFLSFSKVRVDILASSRSWIRRMSS